jgi:replicative DNA helicase
MEIDKIPPQAQEIEEVYLGALLVDPSAIATVKGIVSPEMMYNAKHKVVLEAIFDLERRDKKVDLLTVTEHLKSSNKLENIGGATFIAKLTTRVGSSAHIKEHGAIIYDKFLARELIKNGTDIINKSYSGEEDILDVLKSARDSIEKSLLSALGINSVGISIRDAGEKSVEAYYNREGNIREGIPLGVRSSLKSLDKVTSGFQKEHLIVLAARPGQGKTSLGLLIMRDAAQQNKSVAVYSLEMSAIKLTDKVICAIADVDLMGYKNGKLTNEEKQRIEMALDQLANWKVHLNDDLLTDIDQIYASAQAIKSKQGLDMIIIDYLQLMKGSGKFQNREREVAESSRKAKMMAVKLGVPVILLSQLNRGLEQRSDKRPMLSDLRDSGAIEQDADIVLFIHRESMNNDQAEEGKGELIIAKHREGQTGIIDFRYNDTLTKFSDY